VDLLTDEAKGFSSVPIGNGAIPAAFRPNYLTPLRGIPFISQSALGASVGLKNLADRAGISMVRP
jgi:hypothetical protein